MNSSILTHLYMRFLRLVDLIDNALPIAVYRRVAQHWAYRHASRTLDLHGERAHTTRAAVHGLVQADLACFYGRPVSPAIMQLLSGAERVGAGREDLRLVVSAGLLPIDLFSEIRYRKAELVFDIFASLWTLTLSVGLLALVLCVPSTALAKTCAIAIGVVVTVYCVTWSSSLTWRAHSAFRRVTPALLKARAKALEDNRGRVIYKL